MASESSSGRRLAWVQAGGKCECRSAACAHDGRCNAPLETDKWVFVRVLPKAPPADLAVCIPCYERSHGRQT